MVEDKKEEVVEQPERSEEDKIATDEEVEVVEKESKFDKIYSKVASNRYENLRTSHIETKAKELRKRNK